VQVSPTGTRSQGFCPHPTALAGTSNVVTVNTATGAADSVIQRWMCGVAMGSSPQAYYTWTLPNNNNGAVYIDTCGGTGPTWVSVLPFITLFVSF
jgi:hypothetical protein